MMFFTYDTEISGPAKEIMQRQLAEVIGEDCIVLDMGCTGVYNFPEVSRPKPSTELGAAKKGKRQFHFFDTLLQMKERTVFMEATRDNYSIAGRILQLLAEKNCTVRQAEEILSFVGTTLRQTSTVQFNKFSYDSPTQDEK